MKVLKKKGYCLCAVMLILIISTYIANHVTNVIFHDEAKRLVENYISDNMDGKYLVEVARCYPEVNKIDEWKGKTYVRWNGREQKLLFVSSNLSVESQGKKELEVKDLFVLEKKHGTWQVSWHGVGK